MAVAYKPSASNSLGSDGHYGKAALFAGQRDHIANFKSLLLHCLTLSYVFLRKQAP
ncbi:MAG: hypothetical protein U1F63_10935 [Chitinivorax sp.]